MTKHHGYNNFTQLYLMIGSELILIFAIMTSWSYIQIDYNRYTNMSGSSRKSTK